MRRFKAAGSIESEAGVPDDGADTKTLAGCEPAEFRRYLSHQMHENWLSHMRNIIVCGMARDFKPILLRLTGAGKPVVHTCCSVCVFTPADAAVHRLARRASSNRRAA